jgi:hypothetical protein
MGLMYPIASAASVILDKQNVALLTQSAYQTLALELKRRPGRPPFNFVVLLSGSFCLASAITGKAQA